MNTNHLGVAALANVEHQRRLDAARTARLHKDAARLAAAKQPRWSLALRVGRLRDVGPNRVGADVHTRTRLSVAGGSGS
jgi:hypothetical protein